MLHSLSHAHVRPFVIGALVALAACGGGSAAPMPDGPVKAGVLSGNNQVVAAARLEKLPQPVGVQLVQVPNGQVSLRLLDALLPPKAYAQTGVVGVPNKALCAAKPRAGERALQAEIECYITDLSGTAYFTMLHDSIAGLAIARIGYGTPSGTVITDSVTATVMPGPPKKVTAFHGDTTVKVGTVLDLRPLIYTVKDVYGNDVKTYQISWLRVNVDTTLNDRAYTSGTAVTIRAGEHGVAMRVDSADAAGFLTHVVP